MATALYLNDADLTSIISMADLIDYAKEAYELYGKYQAGRIRANFSPMISFQTNAPHADADYRAGTMEPIPAICSTLGWGFWDNPAKFGLPSVSVIVSLNDMQNGTPISLMSGYYLGAARTGAAGGVCSTYLAKRDPRSLGLIGAGTVAKYMLSSHLELYKHIAEVNVWSRNESRSESFAREMQEKYRVEVKTAKSPRGAVEGIDIVCAATPSRTPVIKNEWVGPGTHINAFGADAKGKQELDPEILRRAKIVVDSIEQCKIGGEINVPLSQGLLDEKSVYGQIGEIVNGWKKGRTSDSEVTVMDATGLNALDVVTYYRAFEKARKAGVGIKLEL